MQTNSYRGIALSGLEHSATKHYSAWGAVLRWWRCGVGWNLGNRRAFIIMRILGSTIIALVALWLVDMLLNQGHYADVALTVARAVARSMGLR